MTNQELIADIKKNFEEIKPGKSGPDVQSLIYSITRSLNRLKLEDEKKSTSLRRFAVDLMQIYTGEVNFYNLNKQGGVAGTKEKMELSESFFKSLGVLRDQLKMELEKI